METLPESNEDPDNLHVTLRQVAKHEILNFIRMHKCIIYNVTFQFILVYKQLHPANF